MKYRKDQMLQWTALVMSFTFVAYSTSQQANQTNTTQTTISPSLSVNITTTVKPVIPFTLLPCSKGKDVWNVCWLSTPPYVFRKDSKNSTDITGILIEALKEGMEMCGCKTKLIFKEANNYDEFLNCSDRNDIDIILPFPEQKATLKTWLYTVVDSPNIYLLLNRKTVETEAKNRVLSQFLSVWTIAVLTILLAIIFGILVWFLDMAWNTEQFPPTFLPGSLEGVWWSFVTLTTVGYGDKTPKFPVARILAVVWMFVGMGMISLLTATMTKALTTAVFDYQTYIQSKNTIGVLNNSYTYDEAVKKGVQPYVFSNLDEMYKTLDDPYNKKIGGILVDIFVATYVKNNPNRFKLSNTLFVAKSYDVVYPLAFYLGRGVTNTLNPQARDDFTPCFETTFHVTNKQIKVYAIVDKYIQRTQRNDKNDKENIIKFEIDLFNSTESTFIIGVEILCGVLGVLIFLGILWQIIYRHRFKSKNFSSKSKGADIESISMTPHAHKDVRNLRGMMQKMDEVDKALKTLSEFKEIFEQYKKDTQRYDSGIVNGTNHTPGASSNKGFIATT